MSVVSFILYSFGWYIGSYSVPIHPKNLTYFLLTLPEMLDGVRFAMRWFFYETLLFGSLDGWMLQRPYFKILNDDKFNTASSNIEEFSKWIVHYEKIVV